MRVPIPIVLLFIDACIIGVEKGSLSLPERLHCLRLRKLW